MKGGRIPKDILYEELIAAKRNLRRQLLGISYATQIVCKRDMKELIIDENKCKEMATDRFKQNSYLQTTLKIGKKYIIPVLENNHSLKK